MERVLRRCRELGFALAGVCEARPTDYRRELQEWLAAGRHGEMKYLERNAEVMCDPSRLLAGAKSIICVADRYPGEKSKSQRAKKSTEDAEAKSPVGRVAAYAQGDDYHAVMKKRLRVLADELKRQHPEEEFRVCVDTAPLLEREHAARAGLGAIGKHTLLIARGTGHGSWLLLGEVITTLALAETKRPDAVFRDPCGSCTRCIDACPTGAISPWSVDGAKCVSGLTIEHRSLVDESLHASMGQWVFGCDVCQDVCPHNQPTEKVLSQQAHASYEPRSWLSNGVDLLALLDWTETDRREAFVKSSMKRAKLAMMKRNALIAAGGAAMQRHDQKLRDRIHELAMDQREDEIIRETAAAVLRRIGGG